MSDLPDSGNRKRSLLSTRRLVTLLLSLCAGSVTWGFIHTQDPFFKVGEKYHIRGLGESTERWDAYLVQQSRIDLKNAALVIGILGGALGAAVAIGSLSSVSLSISLGTRVATGTIMGILIGGLAGISGCGLQQVFAKSSQISIEQSAIINATLFGILGTGLGAIVGGYGGSVRAIMERSIVGLIAGVVPGVAYPIIASCLMASLNIETFIPTVTLARFLWLGVGTGIHGLLLPIGNERNIRSSTIAAESSGLSHD